MFDNIGRKIKILAQAICWIGIIASVVGAIVLWMANSSYNPTIALGFGVLIGGCLVSWISSFFTFGFGELVECACNLNKANIGNKANKANKANPFSQQTPCKWQCSQCATINASSTCTNCGKTKSLLDKKCS